jgi:putative transposase
VIQAFRYELTPNDKTRAKFMSHCGASRFAFNWGLRLVKAQLDERARVREACFRELLSDEETEAHVALIELCWSMPALRKAWNREKRVVAPWWAENSKFAYESGLKALADALSNYAAAKRGARRGASRFPRFKSSRGAKSCRFWAASGLGVIDERHVRLPRIGIVRAKEMTSELLGRLDQRTARIFNATITEEAGRWFVSFCCEVERSDAPAHRPDEVVGVDLGVVHLAVLSTGQIAENSKPLNHYRRKMARLQREVSRRKQGSKRRERTKIQLARVHRRVRCVRADALHQLTSGLAANYGTVVIEDLFVAGMTASPRPLPDRTRPGRHLRNVETENGRGGEHGSQSELSPAKRLGGSLQAQDRPDGINRKVTHYRLVDCLRDERG